MDILKFALYSALSYCNYVFFHRSLMTKLSFGTVSVSLNTIVTSHVLAQ